MKNNQSEMSRQFKEELKMLLAKYNASIEWTCGECSDLAGIYDEELVVTFAPPSGKGWKIFQLKAGSCVEAKDL